MFKGAVKALMPKVELPRYFQISSKEEGGKVRVEATINLKNPKVYSTTLPTAAPSLLDVIKAFPDVDTESLPPLAVTALGFVVLPTKWDLECRPAETLKEGFRLTLDLHRASGTKRWEKEFEVTSMQLAELVDVLDWVREANKIDRHGR